MFNANMLRAELIEKRLAAAKASSEVKVAKVRHAQRYAPSPTNVSAWQQRLDLACTGVTTSVCGPILGIDRRKNRRDARRRSRCGTLSLAALFQHHGLISWPQFAQAAGWRRGNERRQVLCGEAADRPAEAGRQTGRQASRQTGI